MRHTSPSKRIRGHHITLDRRVWTETSYPLIQGSTHTPMQQHNLWRPYVLSLLSRVMALCAMKHFERFLFQGEYARTTHIQTVCSYASGTERKRA
jgi:hypothetical protein